MAESNFKFLGYRISDIHCEIKDNFNTTTNRFNQTINIQQNYDENNNRFVEVILDINIISEDNTFNFFIKIKGGFQGDNDMSDKLFKTLSEQNGPAILFPFARAIITSYTAQANIPPIILPTINFVTKKRKTKTTRSKK